MQSHAVAQLRSLFSARVAQIFEAHPNARSDPNLAAAEAIQQAAAEQALSSLPKRFENQHAVLEPVAGTNLDGVEGSTIPGGCHAARYGGGDDYRAINPLLSLSTSLLPPVAWHAWQDLATALSQLRAPSRECTEAGIQALRNRTPLPAASLTWSTAHLVITTAPSMEDASDARHLSLMLHGWLFRGFAASNRKGHQKFPLLGVFEPTNLASPGPDAGPEWLRLDGSFGWADQHVHRDEPIDLGGFLFTETFVGSDMARVLVNDPSRVASLWLAAVDTEASAALLTLCLILPHTAAEGELCGQLREQRSVEGIASLLRANLQDCEETTAALATLAALDADFILPMYRE